MKAFISVDMEGLACVTDRDHVKLEGPAYEAARKWMTAEANAAVEGALAGGATQVVISDGHGTMRNLIPEELHEDASIVQGIPRPLLMMEGLDATFAAALFVGYHARAGHPLGTLAHSFSGRLVRSVGLNRQPVSEAVFNAAVAGHFGVPVVMISGDDQLAEEIQERLPWAERVITKWAISATSSRSLTPQAAQARIRHAAKSALQGLPQKRPLQLPSPILFEVQFQTPTHASIASDIPGVRREDPVTVSYSGSDMLEVNRIWRVMLNSCMNEVLV
jgi:D-amino peptidase